MNLKALFLLLVAIQTFLFAPLSLLLAEDSSFSDDIDFIAPDIEYKPSGEAAFAAKPMTVMAKITDNKGVQNANLFYRPAGKEGFLKVTMTANNDNVYSAIIPGEEVFEPRMEYFFEATDTAGNTVSKGSSTAPLVVSIIAAISPQGAVPTEKPFALSLTTLLEPAKPWYKKWWVWSIVAVVAGGAAAASGQQKGALLEPVID